MLALQQLLMEQYNDAFAKVAGLGELRDEAFSRPTAMLNDTEAIAEHIIPALTEKAKILAEMQNEHQQIGEPQSNKLRTVYQDFTNALRIMKERAQLQLDGFSAFVDGEYNDIDVTKLDIAELKAMDTAILNLNDIISNSGLSGDDFLKINCDAFNSVRKSVGLSPLSNQQFQEIYFAGISGEPARFFRDN